MGIGGIFRVELFSTAWVYIFGKVGILGWVPSLPVKVGGLLEIWWYILVSCLGPLCCLIFHLFSDQIQRKKFHEMKRKTLSHVIAISASIYGKNVSSPWWTCLLAISIIGTPLALISIISHLFVFCVIFFVVSRINKYLVNIWNSKQLKKIEFKD